MLHNWLHVCQFRAVVSERCTLADIQAERYLLPDRPVFTLDTEVLYIPIECGFDALRGKTNERYELQTLRQ